MDRIQTAAADGATEGRQESCLSQAERGRRDWPPRYAFPAGHRHTHTHTQNRMHHPEWAHQSGASPFLSHL